jgi:thymidylate synthase (FAD)
VETQSRTPRSPATRDLGMKATLLFPTREIAEQYYLPLIYTACRTCYSELLPEDIFDRATSGQVATEKQQDLIRRVIESGHGSTIEHIVFTFAISGVTRTLSHQLVRHRAGVAFDQQSQRYLNYKRPSYMVPGSLTDAPPEMRDRFVSEMDESLAFYGEMLEAGIPGEDARFVMPNATRTNLIMTANLRALIHMSGLRLCTMAQWEIRRLFQLIRHEVFGVSPFLGSFLAPKCVPLGYCDEDRNRDEHCPIRPHKDNVLAAWAEKKAGGQGRGQGPAHYLDSPRSGAHSGSRREAPLVVHGGCPLGLSELRQLRRSRVAIRVLVVRPVHGLGCVGRLRSQRDRVRRFAQLRRLWRRSCRPDRFRYRIDHPEHRCRRPAAA